MLTARQLEHPPKNYLKQLIKKAHPPVLEGQSKILVYVSLDDKQSASFKGRGNRESEIEREVDIFDTVLSTVAMYSRLSDDRIKSKARQGDVIRAREVIVWIMRWVTRMTCKQIGIELSNENRKDHSTVINATRQAFVHIKKEDEYFMELYVPVIEKLKESYSIEFDMKDEKKAPVWYKKLIGIEII